MGSAFTRRLFLTGLPAAKLWAASGNGQTFPSEAKRYSDPATEFEILRLTDPSHASRLPPYYSRAISRRTTFLIYSGDRAAAPQAYRMDLKSFESRQLTNAEALSPHSLSLSADEKWLYYADAGTVFAANLSNLRHRTLYQAPRGFSAAYVSVADDSTHACVVEAAGDLTRLRIVRLAGSVAVGTIESREPIADPMPRPRRAGVLYRRGGELWLTDYDGSHNRRLRTAAGAIGSALWSADGRTILYLNFPEDRKQLHNIREFAPDTNEDRLVANTSQYACFGRNTDASVFAGASGSKASPYVLLMARAVKRELALCEHKASDPSQVAPVFSPNSQRVFFHSDRHGKMAIYSVRVERLVEETDS